MSTAHPKLTSKWLVLLLLFGISVFNYGDRYLLSGLVEPIKAEFDVTDGFMGLLLGPAFAVFYSILAIPIAFYADRYSRINIICIGCVVWSFFTVLSGYADSIWFLAGARLGVGVGEAAFQAPAFSLLAAYFAPEQRGKAFAVMALSTYLGQILGYRAGPEIASYDDWRLAFKVMGSAGFVVVVIAWLLLKEPPRNEDNKPTLPLLDTFSHLIKVASYRNMMIGMGLGVMSGIAFGFWGPALFARQFGVSLVEAGSAFGVAFTVPGMVGALLFGALADWISKGGYERSVLLSSGALAMATLALLAAIAAPNIDVAMLWAIPAGLLGGGWAVGIYAGLQYILPDPMRATGTALAMLVVNMLGFVIGPWSVGAFSDLLALDGTQLQLSLAIVVPVGFLGAVLIGLAARTLNSDRENIADLR